MSETPPGYIGLGKLCQQCGLPVPPAHQSWTFCYPCRVARRVAAIRRTWATGGRMRRTTDDAAPAAGGEG